MPTYDYKCRHCGREESVIQTISQYCSSPARPRCCHLDEMERKLSVVPGSAVNNALAGDRHYDGLASSDGADISTRSKHRAYMKSRDLAMASDFKNTWAEAQKKRQAMREGKPDPSLKREVAEIVHKAIQTA